jgi:hypothetical protein
MTRRLNLAVWIGFLVVLAALVTYVTVFVRFPAPRDRPWPTFLLFAAGLALLARGIARAYRRPDLYRGKVAGPVLAVLGVALTAFFGVGLFHFARQIPPSHGAPRVGDKAPDFTLPDVDGDPVTLSGLLGGGEGGADRAGDPDGAGGTDGGGVLLVFYRGHW